MCKSQNKINNQNVLQERQRYAENENHFLSLVMRNKHSDPYPKRTETNRRKKQIAFRNSSIFLPRTFLVIKHQDKREDVDDGEGCNDD